jgi:DNA-binding NarL/FixJ family response regulator
VEEECWQQILIEDKRATPADVAACRIDFAEWLRRLTARLRKIALALASGETTKGVAEQFGLSPARISQLREWLRKNWEGFQGEAEIGGQPQTAAA